MTKSTLNAAIFYSQEKKWSVLPVWPIRDGRCACGDEECGSRSGKHPVTRYNGVEIVPRGVLDATTNEQTIREWWGLVPDANIGLRGEKFFAIDIDEEEAYSELVDRYGRLPETVESLSGSGGRHILFNQPKGSILGNETGDIPKGIDIRGKNGYIIAPPSMHYSGNRYEWELSSHPRDVELADPPDWLVQAITANDNKVSTQVEFTDVDAPELAVLDISNATKQRILNAPPEGADRSELDMQVAIALAGAGCDASQIRAIFSKYPLGTEGKYAERGDSYLERTAAKAISWAKPSGKVASKIVPGREVSPAEARIEQVVLSLAYQRGWADALASSPGVIPKMWPQYLGLTESSIAYYDIGMQTDYKIEGNDFPALVIPYRTGGNLTALDLTLYGQPDGSPARMWETINNNYVFDTDVGRTTPFARTVLVTEDWDTAMFSYLKHGTALAGIDIVGQPAARSQPNGKLARLRALAELLAGAERVVLAWPQSRKPEAIILARLMDDGANRVKWVSMPAPMREMYTEYSLEVAHIKRFISQATSVIQ